MIDIFFEFTDEFAEFCKLIVDLSQLQKRIPLMSKILKKLISIHNSLE